MSNPPTSVVVKKMISDVLHSIYLMCLKSGYFSAHKSYVGRTMQTLEKRFAVHKHDSQRRDSKVGQFMQRVGSENLKMVLL